MLLDWTHTFFLYNLTKKRWLTTAHVVTWSEKRGSIYAPTLRQSSNGASILRLRNRIQRKGPIKWNQDIILESLQPTPNGSIFIGAVPSLVRDRDPFVTLLQGEYVNCIRWIVRDGCDRITSPGDGIRYGWPTLLYQLKEDGYLGSQALSEHLHVIRTTSTQADRWMFVPTQKVWSCNPQLNRCLPTQGDSNLQLNIRCGGSQTCPTEDERFHGISASERPICRLKRPDHLGGGQSDDSIVYLFSDEDACAKFCGHGVASAALPQVRVDAQVPSITIKYPLASMMSSESLPFGQVGGNGGL